MPFAAFLISKIQFKCPWVGQAARKSSRYFGWWGHTHRPAWEEYSQLRSSLRSLPRSASHSPGADEQPSAEWRRPVLVDQPSGDRAVEQAKEAQQPQLGSLKLGPAEWSLTGVGLAESKPALPPDARQRYWSKTSPKPSQAILQMASRLR